MDKDMISLFDNVSKRMFGMKWSDCRKENICLRCGKSITGFKDEYSSDYYDVAGYCQQCQDGEFEPKPEAESYYDICPACHEGDMEGGVCNKCMVREIIPRCSIPGMNTILILDDTSLF